METSDEEVSARNEELQSTNEELYRRTDEDFCPIRTVEKLIRCGETPMSRPKPWSDRLKEKTESLLKELPSTEPLKVHDELLQVVHELHVHQIELELQNEKLLRVQKELEQSRQNYMRLYDDAPVGYVVLDQSGITRKVNKTFAEMLGGDSTTMSGTPFTDFLVADDRSIFKAGLKAFYKNPENKQIDVHLSKSDTSIYVSLRAINAENHQPTESSSELLVTVTDINERQTYQAALEEKRHELEEILSSISDGFIALDKHLNIQYFNSAAETLLGAERDEVIDRYIFDAFPAAKGSEFELQYREALKAQKAIYFETHFTAPPFNDWYEVAAYPYSDGLSVFFRVITKRKELEKNLLESRRALSLYNSIATIFLTSEGEQIFHEVLELLLKTFDSDLGFVGYINARGDLVCPTMTRHIWEKCQIPEKDIIFPRKSWGGLWGTSLIEKRSLIANEHLHAPAGHLTLNNAMAVPVINHDRIIGQFVLANKAEGYTRQDLELLEKAANQTAPILQSLLDKIEQQKLQDRLDRAKRELLKVDSLNRMAGAIAHNYNNLLTIVIGGIEMARKDLPKDSQRVHDSLNFALEAASKGGEIGNTLLMYLGQSKGDEVITDLVQLTQEFLAKLSSETTQNFEVKLDVPQKSPVISVDPQHIEKLLGNLLTNAAEAQGDDREAVILNMYLVHPNSIPVRQRFPMDWQPLNEQYACLEVVDNGCGIDPENVEKLFDPYYSEKFTGRGMGLAIVLGIVQIYNGVITVESKKNHGSTFRVYLPIFTENGKNTS